MPKVTKTTTKEKIPQEFNDQDYDVLLDDESWGNSAVTIIATIILTMATISGIGYWAHLGVIDKQAEQLENNFLQLEKRLTAEIRIDNSGSLQLSNLEQELATVEGQLQVANASLAIVNEENTKLTADLEAKMAELELQKSSFEEQMKVLNEKITNVEAQTSNLNSRIEVTN
ncbi:hypothetical protein ISS03_01885 [Patescibacteria group bacterium]|nr:hypothetical protein [Patescibacteria group bacterium]